MEKKQLDSYYDFACETFDLFETSYNSGLVNNNMGALAQEACEKFLKHIIDVYIVSADDEINWEKIGLLRVHSLKLLLRFINEKLDDFPINNYELNDIDGFYYTTRYPSEESIILDEQDIKHVRKIVRKCKRKVDEYIEKKENEKKKERELFM